MAVIESALYEILSTTAAITAHTDDRIYPLRMPDDSEFPALTFQDVATTRPNVLNGRVGYRNAIMQIDCWASVDRDSIFTALELAQSVYLTLQGLRQIIGGVDIQSIIQENQQTLYEEALDLARISQVYRIQFLEE